MAIAYQNKLQTLMLMAATCQIITISFMVTTATASNGVFSVKYKYAGRGERSLAVFKQHDNRRRLRIRTTLDIPIGGRPDATGLYYAKIGIGTPSKDYYVQVDTGSDIMWVNCIECDECPRRSSIGFDLTLYNLEDSATGRSVPCDNEFCHEVHTDSMYSCTANEPCPYIEQYGDGTITSGYVVKDVVHYARVSGDLETATANGTVMFGCGTRQTLGYLDKSNEEDAVDGILGFGKSSTSMISQLASSGKVKKMFAHCLDGVNGGGIFAIGHVVQPKVNMTPLVPNQPHYNINMTAIQVGHDFLSLPLNVFETGDQKGTIIDSGTTLAYLPEVIYELLVSKIMNQHPELNFHTVQENFKCLQYSESVDDVFPTVTFYFENSVYLKVHPHEYLFPYEGLWCMGWRNSRAESDYLKNMTILGDLVLSNKLVLYDLENEVIGWTDYNCSSTIEVQDEVTGTKHLVGSHTLSSDCHLISQWTVIFLLAVTMLLHCSLRY